MYQYCKGCAGRAAHRQSGKQCYQAIVQSLYTGNMGNHTVKIGITEEQANMRLDQALSVLLRDRSRSQIQEWIRAGRVRLDGALPRQRDRVAAGQHVEIEIPEPPENDWKAQSIPLDIIHEDETLLVVNKPAGLVVHPGAGNIEGTLLNALLAHAPQLGGLARAGIVHRLDKDTTGLLVVAKTEGARLDLIEQLQRRGLAREYLAIVNGVMISGGTVEAPLGRHPRERTRMAVTGRGKPAVTHYRIKAKYRAHTLLQVHLETGRTHQIRVHMAHIRHPILGDSVYGGRLQLPAAATERFKEALRGFKRQALHALKLGLIHPVTGEAVQWESPVPEDLQALIQALEEDRETHRASRSSASGKRY